MFNIQCTRVVHIRVSTLGEEAEVSRADLHLDVVILGEEILLIMPVLVPIVLFLLYGAINMPHTWSCIAFGR